MHFHCRIWRNQTSTDLEIPSILVNNHSTKRCCSIWWQRNFVTNHLVQQWTSYASKVTGIVRYVRHIVVEQVKKATNRFLIWLRALTRMELIIHAVNLAKACGWEFTSNSSIMLLKGHSIKLPCKYLHLFLQWNSKPPWLKLCYTVVGS